MKRIWCWLLLSSSCLALTPCQTYVIQSWLVKSDFRGFAVSNLPNCNVTYPTIADANVVAESWVSEVHE